MDSLAPNLRDRVRVLNEQPINPSREYVLYWMCASRRTHDNFALERAIAIARALNKPLWVLEALNYDHPHASARHHAFAMQGMADNAEAFARSKVGYFAFPELARGQARGLIDRWLAGASVVITDDWPVYIVRSLTSHLAERAPVRVEAVDSVGLVPMALPDRCFSRAHDFRRWCQREWESWLGREPKRQPLRGAKLPPARELPKGVSAYRRFSAAQLRATAAKLDPSAFERVVPVIEDEGGTQHAQRRLQAFIETRLPRYLQRNQPDASTVSQLSPYLHWGHISAHAVFAAVLARHPEWDPSCLSTTTRGQREGWWGLPAETEAFLDQLLTWRELGHNMVWHREDYMRYESLPAWAQLTLREHGGDRRPYLYRLEQFERAETHDEIWNAAQRELVTTGRMHNYLRMLWGKKILHWSETPREALATMLTLNDRYALDGRDPNSYSGIFWVLGRYDRAWGPERDVFGKIRYMTSDSTRRKLRLKGYLQRFGPQLAQGALFED